MEKSSEKIRFMVNGGGVCCWANKAAASRFFSTTDAKVIRSWDADLAMASTGFSISDEGPPICFPVTPEASDANAMPCGLACCCAAVAAAAADVSEMVEDGIFGVFSILSCTDDTTTGDDLATAGKLWVLLVDWTIGGWISERSVLIERLGIGVWGVLLVKASEIATTAGCLGFLNWSSGSSLLVSVVGVPRCCAMTRESLCCACERNESSLFGATQWFEPVAVGNTGASETIPGMTGCCCGGSTGKDGIGPLLLPCQKGTHDAACFNLFFWAVGAA
mmetsp:Transcript_6553/g.13692  ORF Transcript_6553/g.13692 Transcript_6553/m.13692 type:complete len:277 (-) Transcript_6553:575-1405(-)